MFAPMVVNLLGFKVNVAERNTVISLGPVTQVDMFQSNKRIQGYGEQNGDLSPVYLPINGVTNQVISDANAVKGSFI